MWPKWEMFRRAKARQQQLEEEVRKKNVGIRAANKGLMKKAVKYLKKLTAQKQTMDETEYIMSSPKMIEIIRQGEEDIKNGRGRVVKLEDLWK